MKSIKAKLINGANVVGGVATDVGCGMVVRDGVKDIAVGFLTKNITNLIVGTCKTMAGAYGCVCRQVVNSKYGTYGVVPVVVDVKPKNKMVKDKNIERFKDCEVIEITTKVI